MLTMFILSKVFSHIFTEFSPENIRHFLISLKKFLTSLYTVKNKHDDINRSAFGFALLINLDNIKGTAFEFNVACFDFKLKTFPAGLRFVILTFGVQVLYLTSTSTRIC